MRSGDYEIKRTGKGIAEAVRYAGSDTVVTIPEEIDGYRIVQIGPQFLKKTNKVSSIVLPPSVEAVSPDAFTAWRNVSSVSASGKRLRSIDGVLYDGQVKTLLFYPPKKVGEEFVIPSSVTSVDSCAFSASAFIKRLYVPGSLSSFSPDPSSLPFLESVIADDGMKSMKVQDGVLFKGKKLVFYPAGKPDVKYAVPEGVEEICSMLSDNLRMLSVPASLKSGLEDKIGFLERVDVARENSHYRSVDGVLFSQSGTLLRYPSRRDSFLYAVPNGTAAIADGAFRGAGVRAVVIPSGLTAIGREAFAESAITSIMLPMSILNIDMMAFYGAENMKEIYVERASTADVFLQAGTLKSRIVYCQYL